MIRILISVCLLGFISGQALASKARLEALGEEKTWGSYWIEDDRNIFYNPALINKYKDMISFEWGADTTNSQDTADSPRGEGGYIAETRSLVYGMWFGRESGTANLLRSIPGGPTSTTFPGEDNKLEFFIGGDAGVQWGASVAYSSTTDDAAASKSQSASASFGANWGDSELFSILSLANSAEVGALEYDGGFGALLGYTQKLRSYKLYFELQYINFDYTFLTTPAVLSAEFTTTTGLVGFSKTKNLNEKAKIYSKFELSYATTEVESSGGEKTELAVPLAVGFEFEAKKWLTFRGSVSQTIYSDTDQDAFTLFPAAVAGVSGNATDTNTTRIAMGTGFHFDGLNIDLGMSSNASDSFSSRASLIYNY